MRIQELTEYLDTYLRAGEFHDYAPNGLQVEVLGRLNTSCSVFLLR